MSDGKCLFPGVKECTDEGCPVVKGILTGVPILFKKLNVYDQEINVECSEVEGRVDISINLYLDDRPREKIVSGNVNCIIFPDTLCRREACPAWFELEDFSGCVAHLAELGVDDVKPLIKQKAAQVGGIWEKLKQLATGEDRYTEKPVKKEE